MMPTASVRSFYSTAHGRLFRLEQAARTHRPKNPPACDYHAYKDRNRIERIFNRIKQFRRIATRYDKTKISFAAFLAIAAAKIWLPHFVNMT
jgi:transposase|uniref:transposase n=1 Tax=Rhizobium rhizogenes TaxID=359 RepID=UPI002868DA47|nr:transposase [Rhizobium rhizogenes]